MVSQDVLSSSLNFSTYAYNYNQKDIVTKFSSLAAPEVGKMTTYGAVVD